MVLGGDRRSAERRTSAPPLLRHVPRVLGRYVREEHVLILEDAIRKMTSANAAKIGILDRGILRPGMMADVTVFDAAKIIDNATYENPHQYATGVEYVIVNGQVVLDHGQHTGARPGVILKRQDAGSIKNAASKQTESRAAAAQLR